MEHAHELTVTWNACYHANFTAWYTYLVTDVKVGFDGEDDGVKLAASCGGMRSLWGRWEYL